jgi:hypothetical protein
VRQERLTNVDSNISALSAFIKGEMRCVSLQ